MTTKRPRLGSLHPLAQANMSAFALWEASREDGNPWCQRLQKVRYEFLPVWYHPSKLPVKTRKTDGDPDADGEQKRRPWVPTVDFPPESEVGAMGLFKPWPFRLWQEGLFSRRFDGAADLWGRVVPNVGTAPSNAWTGAPFVSAFLSFLVTFEVDAGSITAAVAASASYDPFPVFKPDELPAERLLREFRAMVAGRVECATTLDELRASLASEEASVDRYLVQSRDPNARYVRLDPTMTNDDVDRLVTQAIGPRPAGRPNWWDSSTLLLDRMNIFALNKYGRNTFGKLAEILGGSDDGGLEKEAKAFGRLLEEFRNALKQATC